jgi:alkylhydroperoxidase family enzyme
MAAVTPIETPTTDELREFYERMEQTSRGLGVLNIFKVMAHSPQLMDSWWRMMAVLLSRLQLDPRLRELAILRLFQLTGTAYGFAHHVRLGKEAGLTDEEIASMKSYANSDRFSALDKLVLQYTDAVTRLEGEALSLATKLRAHLSEQEIVELTFCIANWNMMAHLLLPLEIELEPAVQPLLPADWRE